MLKLMAKLGLKLYYNINNYISQYLGYLNKTT